LLKHLKYSSIIIVCVKINFIGKCFEILSTNYQENKGIREGGGVFNLLLLRLLKKIRVRFIFKIVKANYIFLSTSK